MRSYSVTSIFVLFLFAPLLRAEEPKAEVKETAIAAPNGVTIKVRMQGPYDIETPLQVVCYFRHKEGGDKTLGAAVELDKRLRGVIASLRDRKEFVGNELETLLLSPPDGTIKAKRLLLVGLGEEDMISLDKMEGVGRVALREAGRLGVNRAAFAPLIRDQGNGKFPTSDVAKSVLTGMLLAYDTEKRLVKEGLAKDFSLEEWVQEAGPQYFDETVAAARQAVDGAKSAIAKRGSSAYATSK